MRTLSKLWTESAKSKLRPKHQVEIYSEVLSECQTSDSVTLMDQGWFYDGMHRIPPPGQKDETSVWSQSFQSCHVKANWLPQ